MTVNKKSCVTLGFGKQYLSTTFEAHKIGRILAWENERVGETLSINGGAGKLDDKQWKSTNSLSGREFN